MFAPPPWAFFKQIPKCFMINELLVLFLRLKMSFSFIRCAANTPSVQLFLPPSWLNEKLVFLHKSKVYVIRCDRSEVVKFFLPFGNAAMMNRYRATSGASSSLYFRVVLRYTSF